jgi:putative transposase
MRERFGASAAGVAGGPKRRHDTAAGSSPTTSRPRSPSSASRARRPSCASPRATAAGCAERFIRTLKANLLWVRRFATVEELRLALLEFRRCYNETWIVARHGYRTPAQVRADQLGALTAAA